MEREAEAQALTVAEAAEFLSVHIVTAYRMIADGRLPAARVGVALRVRRADLDALFVTARKEPQP